MATTFPLLLTVLIVLCLTSQKVSADDTPISLDGFDSTNPAHKTALQALQQVLNGGSASVSQKPIGEDGDIDLEGYDSTNPAHQKALKEFQDVLEGKLSSTATAEPSFYEATKSRASQAYQRLPSIPSLFSALMSYLPSVPSWFPSFGSIRSYSNNYCPLGMLCRLASRGQEDSNRTKTI